MTDFTEKELGLFADVASMTGKSFSEVAASFIKLKQIAIDFNVSLVWSNPMKDMTPREYEFEAEMLELYEYLPGANIEGICCPDESHEKPHWTDLHDMIIHLNDHHHWSRERIADWVDEFEDKEGVDLSFRKNDE